MKNNWDIRFLELARFVSKWSKDPSTKTGAVIVRPNGSVCSMGFNGFPMGVADTPERLNDRPTKYSLVVHCEMNALLFAREPVAGYTLYTTGMSCERCAVHMIQAGIRNFVWIADTPDMISRWGDAFEKTKKLFDEVEAECSIFTLKGE